jgi:hypothetical protein
MRWRATCGVCRSCGLSFLPSHFTLSLCRFPKQSVRQSFGCCGAAHACMQCRSVGWATRTITGQRFVSALSKSKELASLSFALRGRWLAGSDGVVRTYGRGMIALTHPCCTLSDHFSGLGGQTEKVMGSGNLWMRLGSHDYCEASIQEARRSCLVA